MPTNITPEIMPCPFCGSEKHMLLTPTCTKDSPYDPNDRAFPMIRCMGCYVDVPGKDWDHNGKTAREAWNRRAALAAVEPVAWDVVTKRTGEKRLQYQPVADLPFNRERFECIPLFTAPPPAIPAWQDISSAPKDGTLVYLWNANTKRIVIDARWVVEEREGNMHPTCILDGWKSADMDAWTCFTPDAITHWMLPLEIPCPCGAAPAAPSATEASE